MQAQFAQKTALITGGATGIGRATAQHMAAQGAFVVIADINQAAAEHTVELIKAAGGSALFVQCDVGEEQNIVAAIDQATQDGRRLDVMINNAGIGGVPSPIHLTEQLTWERVLLINLTAVFWGQKHAVKAMLKDAKGGAIVNVASIAGLGAAQYLNAYGVSKAGVIQLTQTGATEVAQAGIRINAVCPGWTETPILSVADEKMRTGMIAPVPMKRLGSPAEIADLIAFLASDAASFITGVAYRIDGGLRS